MLAEDDSLPAQKNDYSQMESHLKLVVEVRLVLILMTLILMIYELSCID